MPFIEEDEETKRQRELAEGGGIPISGTQAGTIPGAGGAPQPGAKAPNSFVDVAAYLKANKEQSQATAQRVADTMAQERVGLQSGLQGVTEGYQKNVAAGTVNLDDELVKRAASNPTEFVKNPNDVSSFAKLRDASYAGPGNFEDTADFGTVLERIQSGQAKAKTIDTSEGRKAYLSSMGTNPTAGVVSLDDLLIGADPAARAKLTQAAGGFDTLSGALEESKKKASEALTSGQQATEAAKAGVANRFTMEGGVIPSFQNLMEQKLGTTRTRAQQNAAAIQAAVKQGVGLTDQERELIGAGNWDEVLRLRGLLGGQTPFDDSAAQYERNIDLTPYLTTQNPELVYTKENVATPEDYAMETALQQLSGDNFDILPSDASQAGKAPKSLAQIQGNPESDLRSLLNELDTTFINQYGGFNRGAYPIQNGRMVLTDPNLATSVKGMIDIFNRNPEKLTPAQKELVTQLQADLDSSTAIPPVDGSGGGEGAFIPVEGSDRIRIVGGEFKWWDGTQWVPKPQETRVRDDGTWEKFNYDTGQYEPIADQTKPPIMRGMI